MIIQAVDGLDRRSQLRSAEEGLEFVIAHHPLLPAFASSRLKISRARTLIAELRSKISEFMDRRPIQTFLDPHPTNPEMIGLNLKEPFPLELSAIVGDAIHNLRSALDTLACDMVRLAGKSADQVSYPFSTKNTTIGKAIKNANMRRTSKSVQDHIRELDREPALRRLHDLDIIDKHSSALYLHCGLEITPEVTFHCDWLSNVGRLGSFGVSNARSFLDEAKEASIILTLLIDFHDDPIEGPGFVNDPVIPVLETQVRDLETIIDDFERLHLR